MPKLCSKTSRLHTITRTGLLDAFLTKARAAHGDRYDYSEVVYNNSITTVAIGCQLHGTFYQLPKLHVKGHGCSKCGGHEIDSLRFFRQAALAHGDRYDYTSTIFYHSLSKVTIKCREHGYFDQLPYNHLRGANCPTCARLQMGQSKIIPFDEFVTRARTIHGRQYAYSEDYRGIAHRTTICCDLHGEFQQKAYSHLAGNGCPYCQGVIRTTDRFIAKAKTVHGDRYLYDQISYVNSTSDITVVCRQHGPFQIAATDFLRGSGCRGCTVSHPEMVWLDNLGVPERQKKIRLGNGYVVVDGYDPSTTNVYEFYGDFWHGNPKIYDPKKRHPIRGKLFGQIYNITMKREGQIRAAGYEVISIWESDWLHDNRLS